MPPIPLSPLPFPTEVTHNQDLSSKEIHSCTQGSTSPCQTTSGGKHLKYRPTWNRTLTFFSFCWSLAGSLPPLDISQHRWPLWATSRYLQKTAEYITQFCKVTSHPSETVHLLPLLTWVGIRFGILGVSAAHKSSCKEMLGKLSFHVMQHLGNNRRCPKGFYPFPAKTWSPFSDYQSLPGACLKTGNIPSNSLSPFWNHDAESLPSPKIRTVCQRCL